MLLEAGDHQDGAEVPTEVCIIGAGPAGIAMALELGGAGFRVLVLEAGGIGQSGAAQRLASGESVGHPYYRLDMARIRAFGGSSNHWREWSGMRARPLDPLDFDARPEVDRGGWPFDRASLEPHYRRAQELCALGPFDYETGSWVEPGEAEPLPLPPELAETISFQSAKLGNFPGLLPRVTAGGDVSLMLHAHALEIVTDDAGTRAAHVVVGARPGHRFRVRADVIVLATGGIDNARLLLASRAHHTEGIGNQHDLVGRFFMEHPHVNTGVIVPDGAMPSLALYQRRSVGGTDHIAMLKLPDEVMRREGLLTSAWSLVPTGAANVSPPGRALVGLKNSWAHRRPLPGTLAGLRAIAAHPRESLGLAAQVAGARAREQPTLVQLSMMAEQAPNRSSRVTLSTRRDAFGSPVARLDWRLTDLDLHSIRRTQDLLAEALRAGGVGHVEQRFGEGRPTATVAGGYHHMGTTKMDASPSRGVVDADGRVHGVANLYVTGMSVFPTAGYANPTLTVTALAVRLARHLRADLTTRPTIVGAPAPGAPASGAPASAGGAVAPAGDDVVAGGPTPPDGPGGAGVPTAPAGP